MGRTRHLKIGFKEASALCEVLNSRKWQRNVQTSALPSKVVKRTQGYRKTPFPILDLQLQMTLGISFICQLHLFLQRPEVILSWYMWDPCSYISETHFGARNCTNVSTVQKNNHSPWRILEWCWNSVFNKNCSIQYKLRKF